MPFWKPKKKKKAVHKAKPAKSLPKYEPKPFIPPEIPKIDISANQQKEPQKPAPKKASSPRADDKKYFIETFNKLVSERNRPWDIWKDFVLMTACGGGATLIAAANVARNDLEKAGFNFQNHILFSAQDIEETVALMCYIQLSLLGVAGFVKVGNSLTDPIRNGDSLENYWFTPMYFSDVWHTRRVVSQMMDILREERESNDH